MTAPSLSYLEARAQIGEEESRYPRRTFCEGMWLLGSSPVSQVWHKSVRLDCLEVHREECGADMGSGGEYRSVWWALNTEHVGLFVGTVPSRNS